MLFDESASARSIEAVLEWVKDTTDGSLATLPRLDDQGVWIAVRSDREDCLGRRCPTYKECHYQSARRRMEHADLLIVNHALFFADLAMRGVDADGGGAAVGVLRMPDAYTRMQVASKASTLGAALVLAGGAMGLGDPPAVVRTVVAVVFLALTMPVAAHLLGRAAARTGVPFSDETKTIELPERD